LLTALRLRSLCSFHGKYLDDYNEKIKISLQILCRYLTACSDSMGILIMFIVDSEKRELSVISHTGAVISASLRFAWLIRINKSC